LHLVDGHQLFDHLPAGVVYFGWHKVLRSVNFMLTQAHVPRYLCERHLISPRCIVGSDFVVAEASCRNRNFKALSRTGPSYFLKQGVGAEATATVAHEARVYRFLNESPEADGFLRFLPDFVQYDAQQKVLILESLCDAQDLRDYLYQRGRFPISVAAELGNVLSYLHRITASCIAMARGFGLEERLPWILSIHRPGLSLFHQSSGASLAMIQIIQNSGNMPLLLDELRAAWRTNALTHNDIKWDNCLVIPRRIPCTGSRLKVIDWELANLGDSRWDVGAVIGGYLSSWVLSIPVSGQGSPEQFLHLARYPLERIQRAFQSFWRAYVSGMNLTPVESAEHILHAMKYAAARLLQTAFEQTQHAPNLGGHIICILQLSLNILEMPEEAVGRLLGLSDNRRVIPQ